MMPLVHSCAVQEIRHIAVLIPARNEEVLLPRCLRSVLQSARLLPANVSCDIVVVADACTDRTAQLAAAILHSTGCVLKAAAGNVGAARALAAEEALRRMPCDAGACWLANTDADCDVPANWLLRQLELARAGCAAVTGIIDVDCFAEHSPLVEGRFRRTYLLHPDGTHPHVHGANLGVRADTYVLAGGWNPLSTAEDHDLWGRLRAVASPCLADAGLQVVTSGRRVGRAPLGFAGALAQHNDAVGGESAA